MGNFDHPKQPEFGLTVYFDPTSRVWADGVLGGEGCHGHHLLGAPHPTDFACVPHGFFYRLVGVVPSPRTKCTEAPATRADSLNGCVRRAVWVPFSRPFQTFTLVLRISAIHTFTPVLRYRAPQFFATDPQLVPLTSHCARALPGRSRLHPRASSMRRLRCVLSKNMFDLYPHNLYDLHPDFWVQIPRLSYPESMRSLPRPFLARHPSFAAFWLCLNKAGCTIQHFGCLFVLAFLL